MATASGETIVEAPKDSGPKTDKDGDPIMHIRVSSPFTTYFDAEALSISAVNDTGPFDILPHHHNFITLLNECDIIVRSKQGDSHIHISGGVMHVKADQVVVFLNV
jgi:F0F1-type ATP synthase epsilon subunit